MQFVVVHSYATILVDLLLVQQEVPQALRVLEVVMHNAYKPSIFHKT